MNTRIRISSAKSCDYRYGFQAQEKDDEIKGKGNSYNYTFRMHDTRLGRFFAVDPLTSDYPMLTPYQFSSNSPIYLIEMEGLEGIVYQYKQWYDKDGNIRKEPMGQYEVTGLFADVNKILWKEYNNPNSETIRYDYLVRMPNGESGGGIKNITPSDKPNSAQEVNTALGLTKSKPESKPIEKSMWRVGGGGPVELLFGKEIAEKVRVSEAKMEGNSDPANTGSGPDHKEVKNIGLVIVGIVQFLVETVPSVSFPVYVEPLGPPDTHIEKDPIMN